MALAEQAPPWAFNRSEMWNEVEAEPRKNLRFAKEITVSLPRSLDWETKKEMTRTFVFNHVVMLGVVADICFHTKYASDAQENGHAHIMITTRKIT